MVRPEARIFRSRAVRSSLQRTASRQRTGLTPEGPEGQWKRNWTRMQNLRKRGLTDERAAASAFNGRGPWWNAAASHMNEAYPKRYLDALGLVSLLDEVLRQRLHAT